jgi:hypothetical protein
MAVSRSFSKRLAGRVRVRRVRFDTRALVAVVSIAGLLAWVMPWQAAVFFFVPACVIAFTAAVELRDGRTALAAYGVFVLIWTVSQLLLHLFEHPGEFRAANIRAALLGGRLFTLLGLALAVPLAATPLALGRTLTWYLGWLSGAEKWVCGALFRGRVTPVLAGGFWRAALALSLMMAFFPRSMRAMKELRRSMLMRAPRLAPHKRAALMGLALIRVVGSQTWDMTLAIASRNLYRPEPWEWPKR